MIYLEEYFIAYKSELWGTLISFGLLFLLKFIIAKTIRKVGKISDLNAVRTRLIIKYVSIGLTGFGIVALIIIWGVDFSELGVLLSSVFAVIGVALFAQWSMLSNVTAGVILFFSFPFKIGDRIKILDKEIVEKDNEERETYVIEDIRAFHLHLRNARGELVTYPNNLMLQKAVALIDTYERSHEGSEVL